MIAAVCCSGSPNSKKKDNIKFDPHYGISGDVREVC